MITTPTATPTFIKIIIVTKLFTIIIKKLQNNWSLHNFKNKIKNKKIRQCEKFKTPAKLEKKAKTPRKEKVTLPGVPMTTITTMTNTTLVLKSLSILLGIFFIFLGVVKVTPLSRELHKDMVSFLIKL